MFSSRSTRRQIGVCVHVDGSDRCGFGWLSRNGDVVMTGGSTGKGVNAVDAVVELDGEGRITAFDPVAERMFGRRQAEVLGRPLAQVIILALTAYAMKGDEERARAAGCDGYLAKPIDIEVLPLLIAQRLREAPGPS